MIRVAINGFGRIGRQILRIGLKDRKLRFVAINDLTDAKTLAYLFKYDSVHGMYPGKVTYDKNHLFVDGIRIPVIAEQDPTRLPWRQMGVDIVAECTGRFTKYDECQKHIMAGAKKVLLSAPTKD